MAERLRADSPSVIAAKCLRDRASERSSAGAGDREPGRPGAGEVEGSRRQAPQRRAPERPRPIAIEKSSITAKAERQRDRASQRSSTGAADRQPVRPSFEKPKRRRGRGVKRSNSADAQCLSDQSSCKPSTGQAERRRGRATERPRATAIEKSSITGRGRTSEWPNA